VCVISTKSVFFCASLFPLLRQRVMLCLFKGYKGTGSEIAAAGFIIAAAAGKKRID
jgi:hypothetical protein